MAAASSCVSFRVATVAIEEKRLDLPVSNKIRVSEDRKLLIIRRENITINVKQQALTVGGPGGILALCNACATDSVTRGLEPPRSADP